MQFWEEKINAVNCQNELFFRKPPDFLLKRGGKTVEMPLTADIMILPSSALSASGSKGSAQCRLSHIGRPCTGLSIARWWRFVKHKFLSLTKTTRWVYNSMVKKKKGKKK